MADSHLSDLGTTLTDSFYKGLDRAAILAAIEQRRSGSDAASTVVAVWGIEDPTVLERLLRLGLSTETVAALSLTPLIEVAWADGKVDKKERAAVLAAAEQYGLERSDISYLLLEGRLAERPAPELLDTWKTYVRMLARALDKEIVATLRGEMMARARQVAEASGGLLGLGSKISSRELAKLDELEQSFPV
jgi:uncharacterized tellurite resistance protein B-like protein